MTCELCGVAGSTDLVLTLERRVLRCRNCGLVFSEPGTSEDGPLYSENYYHRGAYANYLGDQTAITRNAERFLRWLGTQTTGRRLLDVGCAAGFFLVAARNAGWTVHGVEVSKYMAEHARQTFGLPVTLGSIEDTGPDLPGADVVTLWDTIEHLQHPVRALANIRQLLSPGGLLIISTGDYESWLRRLTGRRWRLFADPTHNFFFTRASLTRLLDTTGFRVLSVDRRGKWVSLAMVLHQSGIPFASRLQHILEKRGWNPQVYVNPRDVMTVYAQAIQ